MGEVRTVRLDPEMWRIAEKLAKKNELTLNAYMQSVLLEDFLMSGDPEAISYAVKILSSKIKERVRRKILEYFGLEGLSRVVQGSD